MPPSLARALSLAGALGALAGASAFVPSVITPSHQPMDRRGLPATVSKAGEVVAARMPGMSALVLLVRGRVG